MHQNVKAESDQNQFSNRQFTYSLLQLLYLAVVRENKKNEIAEQKMIEALLQQKARLLCRADFLEYVPLSDSKNVCLF